MRKTAGTAGSRVLACMISMIVIMAIFTAFMPVYAADETSQTGTETSQSEETAGKKSKEQTEKEEEKEKIEEYGYYKGTNAKKIPVITYHLVVADRVKNGEGRGSSLVVGRSRFDEQMKWLNDRNYRTINCEEFYLWYTGKIKLPPKTVLVTFDDGFDCIRTQALPVLRKYDMKGTSFVVGKYAVNNYRKMMSYDDVQRLRESQDLLEFQSHTYSLHTRRGATSGYARVKRDALKQKKKFDFEYLAYPYGTNNKEMRRAYKDTGIKLAFTYGNSGYATRDQDIYQIRRIKIYGNGSMADFKRWFRGL